MTEAVKPANDNFDPFSAIGLQAALIVNKLRLQAQLTENPVSEGDGKPDASNGGKQDREDNLQEINGRLSDGERRAYLREGIDRIRRFEDRARGKGS
jgi:hypothetical protein